MHGQFFGGDSYIVLYKYNANNREEAMIYFWQGRDSSKDEIGASALLAKDLDDELGGFPVQVLSHILKRLVLISIQQCGCDFSETKQ